MYWSPPERARLINHDRRRTRGRWGHRTRPRSGLGLACGSAWRWVMGATPRWWLVSAPARSPILLCHSGCWARAAGRGPAGALDGRAVALSLDVGQAFSEPAISDPDDVHATHVPLTPGPGRPGSGEDGYGPPARRAGRRPGISCGPWRWHSVGTEGACRLSLPCPAARGSGFAWSRRQGPPPRGRARRRRGTLPGAAR